MHVLFDGRSIRYENLIQNGWGMGNKEQRPIPPPRPSIIANRQLPSPPVPNRTSSLSPTPPERTSSLNPPPKPPRGILRK